MLELDYKIYYPLNLFYLVDNMSNWAIQCRPHYARNNPEFYKAIKKQLPEYAEIRKKEGWNGEFQNLFATPSMEKVYKKLSEKKEWKKLVPLFRKADKLYRKKWEESKQLLLIEKKLLQINMKKRYLKEIISFLDGKQFKKAEVYLVLNQEVAAGFGGYKRGIVLETGSKYAPLTEKLGVLLHELIHFVDLRKEKPTAQWFKEKGLNRKASSELVEAIFDSVAPHGILISYENLIRYNLFKRVEKKKKECRNMDFKNAETDRKVHYYKRKCLGYSVFPIVHDYWKKKNRMKYETLLKKILKEYDSKLKKKYSY